MRTLIQGVVFIVFSFWLLAAIPASAHSLEWTGGYAMVSSFVFLIIGIERLSSWSIENDKTT